MHPYIAPNLTPAQRVELFEQQFGGGEDPIRVGNHLYFVTGAVRHVDIMGELREPSQNPLERARRVLTYHEAKLRRLVIEFDALKNALLHDENGWANGDENTERLRALQQRVQAAQDAAQTARDDVRRLDPRHRADGDTDKALAATVARRTAYRDAITAIEI